MSNSTCAASHRRADTVSTAEINATLILLPYLLPQGIVNKKTSCAQHWIKLGSISSTNCHSRTEEDRTRPQPFVFVIITLNKSSALLTYMSFWRVLFFKRIRCLKQKIFVSSFIFI
ncbi:hypothetical protein JTE90_024182 [Oedothorax gibbosus]|uniref:Uncharacterized protein n=1 Tax=Oedothorax gibbosus TaxID=931172 RepID=A0AAV6UE33_9ARAC|nr:hypothetical protein JTE90_024182 [Oedothorax gibbosus]